VRLGWKGTVAEQMSAPSWDGATSVGVTAQGTANARWPVHSPRAASPVLSRLRQPYHNSELKIADETVTLPPPESDSQSLDRSLVSGIAWTGGTKWATQLLSWAATLVVARILAPSDYGLMGMAAVYLGLVTLVNEFGLTAAILRHRELTEEQIARVGGFSLLPSALRSRRSQWHFAPLIARFYGEPAVATIIASCSA
jgi:hypothetical protein